MSVLLLQGPLGPFLNHLSDAFRKAGHLVHKVNFNGGDAAYYQSDAINYQGQPKDWSHFLKDVIKDKSVSLVLAYGDCRFYHHEAKRICANLGILYVALEEGYLRPNYITLEVGGVNGHSPIKHAGVEAYQPMHTIHDEIIIPNNFMKRIRYVIKYYVSRELKHHQFRFYQHHRSYSSFMDAVLWTRAYWRKHLYKWIEPTVKTLTKSHDFFLVPLQVHNDAQIEFHSQYDSIEAFIKNVMISFAQSESTEQLIFKHHPMDRGHVLYTKYIKTLANELGISDQVQYIHDQHLPTLLQACKGVVTINSTTALQAFYHGAAVKVMGSAFYDMPGLTDQKSLEEFWLNPQKPDMEFADRFRGYLLYHGQINGSFYCLFRFTCENIVRYMQEHGMLYSPHDLPEKATWDK